MIRCVAPCSHGGREPVGTTPPGPQLEISGIGGYFQKLNFFRGNFFMRRIFLARIFLFDEFVYSKNLFAWGVERHLAFSSFYNIQAQTLTVWQQASKFGLPSIFFLNKMDKQGADFRSALNSIEDRLNMKGNFIITESDYGCIIYLNLDAFQRS